MKYPRTVILDVGSKLDHLVAAHRRAIRFTDSVEDICNSLVDCSNMAVGHYSCVLEYVAKVKHEKQNNRLFISTPDDEKIANGLANAVGDLGVAIIEQLNRHGFYTRRHDLNYTFYDTTNHGIVLRRVDGAPAPYRQWTAAGPHAKARDL